MAYKVGSRESGVGSEKVCAVILVGGRGKRLRPLSTDLRPKPLLSITRDRKTIFKKTVERIQKIVPLENILVVANKKHGKLIKDELPGLADSNLILEPVSRNTAPAVALAAKILEKRSGKVIMVVLPADHYIPDARSFIDSVRKGIGFAKGSADTLLAIGVKPRYPATGFGYIKITRAQDHKSTRSTDKGIFKVEKFVEKPELRTAKKYVRSGRYLWNTGTFVFNSGAILRAIEKFIPVIKDGMKDLNKINNRYKKLPDVSIDYAVMEKADNIYCVRGLYEWRDVGTFDSLMEVLKRESRGFITKRDKVVKII